MEDWRGGGKAEVASAWEAGADCEGSAERRRLASAGNGEPRVLPLGRVRNSQQVPPLGGRGITKRRVLLHTHQGVSGVKRWPPRLGPCQRRHPRLPQGTVDPSVPQPCHTEHQTPAGTGQLCTRPGPSVTPLDSHCLCTLPTTPASHDSREPPEILAPFPLALSSVEPNFSEHFTIVRVGHQETCLAALEELLLGLPGVDLRGGPPHTRT